VTHSCHRLGAPEDLPGDYVVLARVDPSVPAQAGYGRAVPERMRELAGILARHAPLALDVRMGTRPVRYVRAESAACPAGDPASAIASDAELTEVRHAVYGDRRSVEAVLREVRNADLGISLVVSGPFSEVQEACRAAGLRPHSLHVGLGTWGRTDLLPDTRTLHICTMCGHGLVAAALVAGLAGRVERGQLTPRQAAVEAARPCVCNIVNVSRATAILGGNTT
jgi:hypothetical protein